jgi:fatty acid desaturase
LHGGGGSGGHVPQPELAGVPGVCPRLRSEHFGADPDRPIAWGVSTYNRLYNWTWMFNGYHAEHHYRPKVHWTQMVALHRAIADEQKAAGVKVINHCHALGFLDNSLSERSRNDRLEV